MATTNDDRAAKLRRFFNDIVDGKSDIGRRGNQFLEAIFVQPDAATCMNKLVGSDTGLAALQRAVWTGSSPEFFNGPVAKFLKHLSESRLDTIASGSTLKILLLSIVKPPIFWDSFTKALVDGKLDEGGKFGFAWLLYNVIALFSADESLPFRELAAKPTTLDPLLSSNQLEIRNLAQSIKHRLSISASTQGIIDDEAGPGGRHDNDFVDFRKIAIIPTADELQSSTPAFIRPSTMFDDETDEKSRQITYLDNQFRLLREDMLYEIKEELLVEKKQRRHRNFVLDGLKLIDIHHQPEDRRKRGIRWGVVLQCRAGLQPLLKMKRPVERKKWLQDNRHVLRHQSTACLLVDQELITLASINRDEELLSLIPPKIILHVEGDASVVKTLLKLRTAQSIKLIQIDTAMFAYQPILQALQETRTIPLTKEILFWEGEDLKLSSFIQPSVLRALAQNATRDLKGVLRTSESITLDKSQSASFLMGLTQDLSLIQGPPGTGKSFIGALLAKAYHEYAQTKILVVCYTNHALDQFLEDLLDIGIPESSMVRLGGKSTDRTKDLSLHNVQQTSPNSKLTRGDWVGIDLLKLEILRINRSLQKLCNEYGTSDLTYIKIMEHLKSHDIDNHFFHAFTLPSFNNGEIIVDRRGKALDNLYLIRNWINGYDAGALKNHDVAQRAPEVWNMHIQTRRAKLSGWREAILAKQANSIANLIKQYNAAQTKLDAKFNQTVGRVLAAKRIIGCTTTAAAKYQEQINAASPGILLVEEAGEILESHIITSLGRSVRRLILIGDHQQLRPKVNNYLLTVEKGEGYDLNRSLFERLVLKGYPHKTLVQQHRMRPEISELVRHLTYPDLKDAPKTQGRADIRGLRDNVVFIHHTEPEDELSELGHLENKGDEVGAKSSKKNKHEVDMVLKILRYLGQQGYRTDQIVILTPYLGQLRALQDALKKDNDPVLNDLDSADLVRAGLVTPDAAKLVKKPIRLATIDNYQGEESDIVIASLTRSNKDRRIGFMSSPERVNVLLSRARDGLIMIGNARTFMEAKSGDNVWQRLFDLLRARGHVYDGLPVKCERHTGCTADLQSPEEFDQKSPDGGCTQPCGSILKCGIHSCASKCHQISDHSKMQCNHVMYSTCFKGHQRSWKCQAGPPVTCSRCIEEAKIVEKEQTEALLAHKKRVKERLAQHQRMAELETRIALQQASLRDRLLAEREKNVQKPLNPIYTSSPQLVPSKPNLTIPVPTAKDTTAGSLFLSKPMTQTAPNSPQPNTPISALWSALQVFGL